MVVSEGHFVFPLPLSLELAEGSFQSNMEEGREYLIVASKDFAVVAQPKGYRQDAEPFRMPSGTILVRIENSGPGSYAQLGANLSMPREELEKLNADLQAKFVEEGEARGELRNVDWAGTDVVQIEGTQAIRFRYSGDVGPQSDRMVVNTYLVQNNDCIYYITLSYLLEDQKMWAGDLTMTMEQMRFTAR